MQHWHLATITSTDKMEPREAGPDAPRVETAGAPKPQVLFSHPECRGVMVPLAAGGRMDDHVVQERAIITVVTGHVTFTAEGASIDCPAGTVIEFEPGEHHAVDAHEASRLLILLAPWRNHAHGADSLPPNATAEPAMEDSHTA